MRQPSCIAAFQRRRLPLNVFQLARATGAVSLSLFTAIGLAQPGLAQLSGNAPGGSSIVFNAPPPPPGQGAPTGRRDGGASRGECPDYQALTALAPVAEGKVWGQTTAAQPSLWFHLDAAVTPDTTIELYMQDADDNLLYETTLSTDIAAGVFAIALPETVTLPENQPHFWTLAIYCDSERLEASAFVNGTISRVSTDEIASGLEPLTEETVRSLAQAEAYAAAGIWHDALTILGELQQANVTDIDSQLAWTALLEQADLARAAAVPVQLCCNLEQATSE